MKPIAVVHHLINGVPRVSKCYTQRELNDTTAHLREGKAVFVTCLMSLNAYIPSTKPRMVREAI